MGSVRWNVLSEAKKNLLIIQGIQIQIFFNFICTEKTSEPDLLEDIWHTQGLTNPGFILPQVRAGVYIEVETPK
jgi:hypothetical protein